MVAGFRQQPNGCVLAVVEPESGAEGVVATKPERVPSSSTRHSPPARQAAIRQSGGNRRGAAWRQRARDCELVVVPQPVPPAVRDKDEVAWYKTYTM